MKRYLLALPLAALASLSVAQAPEGTPKGYVSLGLYLPSSVNGISVDPGAVLSLGYTFARTKSVDFSVENGGYAFNARDGFGSASVTLSTFAIVLATRPVENQPWYTLGLGGIMAEGNQNGINYKDSNTRSFYFLGIGLNISRTTFATLTYQSTFDSLYEPLRKGIALQFGYRF